MLVGLTACAGLRASIVRPSPGHPFCSNHRLARKPDEIPEISRANARMVVESDRRFLIVDGGSPEFGCATLAVSAPEGRDPRCGRPRDLPDRPCASPEGRAGKRRFQREACISAHLRGRRRRRIRSFAGTGRPGIPGGNHAQTASDLEGFYGSRTESPVQVIHPAFVQVVRKQS